MSVAVQNTSEVANEVEVCSCNATEINIHHQLEVFVPVPRAFLPPSLMDIANLSAYLKLNQLLIKKLKFN